MAPCHRTLCSAGEREIRNSEHFASSESVAKKILITLGLPLVVLLKEEKETLGGNVLF